MDWSFITNELKYLKINQKYILTSSTSDHQPLIQKDSRVINAMLHPGEKKTSYYTVSSKIMNEIHKITQSKINSSILLKGPYTFSQRKIKYPKQISNKKKSWLNVNDWTKTDHMKTRKKMMETVKRGLVREKWWCQC